MLEKLELASSSPTRCVEYITDIATIANELARQTEVEWEKIFFSENPKKQTEIVSMILFPFKIISTHRKRKLMLSLRIASF